MKRIAFWSLIALGAYLLLAGFLPPRTDPRYDLAAFGRLPAQFNTRELPLDSIARNALRLMSDYTAVHAEKSTMYPQGLSIPANQWLLELAFRTENAERLPIFRINNDDVLGLVGKKASDLHSRERMETVGSSFLSFHEIQPYFDAISKASDPAAEKQRAEEGLNPFESEVLRLRDNLVLFQRLSVSFVPGDEPVKNWQAWEQSIPPGIAAFRAKEAGAAVYDETAYNLLTEEADRFMTISKVAAVGIIPPAGSLSEPWSNLGQAALTVLKPDGVKLDPILLHYADAGDALRHDDGPAFNAAVAALHHDLGTAEIPQIGFEAYINQVEPFYRGALLYLCAFLCAIFSWIVWGPELRRAALWLVIFGFVLHTLGLGARVYLTGFGVVTNLYSAALFVGWVAVVFGLVMECWKKGAIGAAVASFVGFGMLIIAHNLPFSGDDLELPRAVLASNLWLWTHVKCIVCGYGAMFVAGSLGAGYLIASTFSARFTEGRGREIAKLTYGVTCFATLFSFVGTMLGGIWADQSWGRFWGWDPKENGALLIVLWCAIFLHARWGKLVTERTQMALAVGGNIVTAWSGLGVNLLGVGLHSYGFMAGTFVGLMIFWASQLAIMALAFVPPAALRRRMVLAPAHA